MPKTLLTIDEASPLPDFSQLYTSLGITETRIPSMRKAIALLKKQQPDFILAEFEYGYGNNYAGVNISNLDVMLHSLLKYSPESKVIVLVDKSEYQYVGKLNDIIALHEVIQHPVNLNQLEKALSR